MQYRSSGELRVRYLSRQGAIALFGWIEGRRILFRSVRHGSVAMAIGLNRERLGQASNAVKVPSQ